MIKRMLLGLACLLTAGTTHDLAAAETYPSRPVSIIMAGAPGGSFDVMLRYVAQKLTAESPEPFLVDNVPGTGGLIATSRGARAKPDGSVLTGGYFLTLAGNKYLHKLDYDPSTAFQPIVLLGSLNYVLVVKADSPYKTLDDLIKAARASPGKISFSTSGLGTGAHVGGELIQSMAKVQMLQVPYPAAAQSLLAIMNGSVSWGLEGMPTAIPQVNNGTLRALAVSSRKRFPSLPDVPTVEELGFPGFEVSGWLGIVAPAGTPKEVTEYLNPAVNKILKMPETQEYYNKLGAVTLGGTPEDFTTMIKAEEKRYGALNLTPQ